MKDINKILRLLKTGKVKVTLVPLLPNLYGMCDFEDKELFIRKYLCIKTQVSTLIHECLHFLNPNRRESWVLAKEKEVYTSLKREEFSFLKIYLRRRVK